MLYLKNVVTLELDESACDGCGLCATVCPHGVFEVEAGKARIVERDACIECGACSHNCPAAAIAVRTGVGCATGLLLGTIESGECCGDAPPPNCNDRPGCCG